METKYKYGNEVNINHPFYGEQTIIIEDYVESDDTLYTVVLKNVIEKTGPNKGDRREITINETEIKEMLI